MKIACLTVVMKTSTSLKGWLSATGIIRRCSVGYWQWRRLDTYYVRKANCADFDCKTKELDPSRTCTYAAT
jgi:hypothetical protein